MQWNADLKGGGVGEGNPQRDDAWEWHRVPDDLPFPCVVFVLIFVRWGGWEERCWRAGNPVAGRGGWVRALPPPTPVSEVTFHTKGAACHPATATVTWATPPTSSWRQYDPAVPEWISGSGLSEVANRWRAKTKVALPFAENACCAAY